MEKEKLDMIILNILIKGLEDRIDSCLATAIANLSEARAKEFFKKGMEKALSVIEEANGLYSELEKLEKENKLKMVG